MSESFNQQTIFPARLADFRVRLEQASNARLPVQEVQARVLVREVDAFSGVSSASRVTFGDFNS